MPYFIIDIFNPPHYNFSALHLKQIEALLGHNSFYASKGCWAFYHCLKSLGVNDQILMPSYICNSIQKPLQILNIKPIYYDIDPDDLNADISSIQFLAKKFHIKALLIASMYGNPANLFEIDLFCKTNGIKLIDDAAQSTGASINNKPIGSFGNAGFFSISPGKPLAGHMGAFFWSENTKYYIKRKQHSFYHSIAYADFYFNRLHRSKYRKNFLTHWLPIFRENILKFIDIKDDSIANFEKKIIGGLFHSFLNGEFEFRKKYHEKFCRKFSNNEFFRCIKHVRGVSSPHKFVLLCKDRNTASHLITYLKSARIYSTFGYVPLYKHPRELPHIESIDKRVIELPIENDERKMIYLFSVLSEFHNQEKYEKNTLCFYHVLKK